MVLANEASALPHGSTKPQTIREGSVVLIDGGCVVEGYESDISRTFTLGKPAEKMKRVFDVVHAAQTAALKAARPGVSCGRGGRCCAKADRGRRVGAGIQVLHTPRRPRARDGRTRVAVPGERELRCRSRRT